jgi:hypothetical protein
MWILHTFCEQHPDAHYTGVVPGHGPP